jgi:enoyl-CoA hydratase
VTAEDQGRGRLAYERHDDVLVITIDRASKSNALDRQTFAALREVLGELAASSVRAVVITGSGGRAFSAGADVGELATIAGESARELVGRGQDAFDAIERLDQPTVAAINGAALGGGLELAMACDLRIAADHATLGLPEMTLGNVPGWGATQRLPRLVGYGRAVELVLTGARISARQALDWGLVSRVVPGTELRREALRYAARLAQHSPVALAQAKRALRIGQRERFDAGLEAELEAVISCSGSAEQREAVGRFLAQASDGGRRT